MHTTMIHFSGLLLVHSPVSSSWEYMLHSIKPSLHSIKS